MGYAKQIRDIVDEYLESVAAVEKELKELEALAQVYSELIASNTGIHSEIHGYEQQIGHLYAQRTELYNDYHNALFEGNTARVLEIEGERDNIDEAVENAQQAIEDSRKKLSDPDPAALAEMLQRLDSIRLPVMDNQWAATRNYGQGLIPAYLDRIRTLHEAKRTEVAQRIRAVREREVWSMYTTRATVTA